MLFLPDILFRTLLVYGILSELYFDINCNVTMNHIQKIIGRLASISLYLYYTYYFIPTQMYLGRNFAPKQKCFNSSPENKQHAKWEAKLWQEKKKKCTGKINSKFYHLSLLMYILFSNLTTCGFILPKEYILEGNKSISYLLFYKDKVSLFSLYQSHHGSWSHILIFLFLFKRQQAKHNVFHEHTDHSQN